MWEEVCHIVMLALHLIEAVETNDEVLVPSPKFDEIKILVLRKESVFNGRIRMGKYLSS